VQRLEEVATVSVPKKKTTQVVYGLALSSSPIVNWLLLVSGGAPSPVMSSCVVCVQSF